MVKIRVPLTEAVEGDRRGALIAIRDYIANQLEGHLCSTCLNSRLRTGDQAALILRLAKIMEEIDQLSDPDEEVSQLDSLRREVSGRDTEAEDRPISGKSAQRRSGSRRTRSDGGP